MFEHMYMIFKTFLRSPDLIAPISHNGINFVMEEMDKSIGVSLAIAVPFILYIEEYSLEMFG